MHRRDHEHGGADPVRIAYESVGGAGGGGGVTLKREIRGSDGASLAGMGSYTYLPFSTVIASGSDTLTSDHGVGGTSLDFLATGLYALTVTIKGTGFPAGKGYSGYIQTYAQAYFSGVSAGATDTYTNVTLVDRIAAGTSSLRIAAVNWDTSARTIYIDRLLIVKFDGVVVA
jgi:hypothetical protein